MKPSEVSIALRRIASRLDNSKNPSRSLVAADIKRLLSRMASLSDVQNEVTRTCLPYGVYEPNMKEVGHKQYKGEFDSGWDLLAEEMSNGTKYSLNGHPVKLEDAVKAYKTKDPKFKSSPSPSPSPQTSTWHTCKSGNPNVGGYDLEAKVISKNDDELVVRVNGMADGFQVRGLVIIPVGTDEHGDVEATGACEYQPDPGMHDISQLEDADTAWQSVVDCAAECTGYDI